MKSTYEELFNAIVKENRVRHAYLFFGNDSNTLKNAILMFSSKLMGISLSEESTEQNPDFMIISSETAIKVGQIKFLQDRVKYGPHIHPKLVVVIKESETLTTEASNAFLKTLEEPPDNVVFILSTTQKQSILPTIRSRCQALFFPSKIKTDRNPTIPSIAAFQSMPLFERMLWVNNEAKDRQASITLITTWIEEILEKSQFTQNEIYLLSLFSKKLDALQYNVNAKLQLEDLAISL